MDLKELLDKYITLTTLNLDRPIMLCANKRTYRYEYFIMEGAKYFLVDDETRKYLDDNFANKMPHLHYMEADEKFMEDNEQELTSKVNLAIKCVAEYFADVQDINKTIEKLEDVKVYVGHNDEKATTKGNYSSDKNKIVIFNEIKLEVLEHEFIHALAWDFSNCGFNKQTLSDEHDGFYYSLGFGSALDEAFTQYFANDINNEEYDYYKNEVFVLKEMLLPKGEEYKKQIKAAYINADLDSYIQILKQYYNLDSTEKIIEMLLNFDLFLMASKKEILNRTEIYLNMSRIYADIALNKINQKSSAKSLKKLASAKLKGVSSNIVNAFINMFTVRRDVCAPEMLLCASNVIYDLNRIGETEIDIPKEWKNNGFVYLLMAKSTLIRQDENALGMIINQDAVLNYIFNSKNKLINKNNIEQVACSAILSNFANAWDLQNAMGEKFDTLIKCSELFQDALYSTYGSFMRSNYPEEFDSATNRKLEKSQEKSM